MREYESLFSDRQMVADVDSWIRRQPRGVRAVAGSVRRATRSGCEHGSTVASTVVAPEAALTEETNDRDYAAAGQR